MWFLRLSCFMSVSQHTKMNACLNLKLLVCVLTLKNRCCVTWAGVVRMCLLSVHFTRLEMSPDSSEEKSIWGLFLLLEDQSIRALIPHASLHEMREVFSVHFLKNTHRYLDDLKTKHAVKWVHVSLLFECLNTEKNEQLLLYFKFSGLCSGYMSGDVLNTWLWLFVVVGTVLALLCVVNCAGQMNWIMFNRTVLSILVLMKHYQNTCLQVWLRVICPKVLICVLFK